MSTNPLARAHVHARQPVADTGPVRNRAFEVGLAVVAGVLAWHAGPWPTVPVALVIVATAALLTRRV